MYPDDARALYIGAQALVATGNPKRAVEWAERALEAAPEEPSVLYNLGCMYSLMGEKDRAIGLVDDAVRRGFGYRAWLEKDGDLDPLRTDPRFQAILERMS
jgi:adenylate cyclase